MMECGCDKSISCEQTFLNLYVTQYSNENQAAFIHTLLCATLYESTVQDALARYERTLASRCDFLASLPAELNELVISYLDIADLSRASRVSRSWFDVISGQPCAFESRDIDVVPDETYSMNMELVVGGEGSDTGGGTGPLMDSSQYHGGKFQRSANETCNKLAIAKTRMVVVGCAHYRDKLVSRVFNRIRHSCSDDFITAFESVTAGLPYILPGDFEPTDSAPSRSQQLQSHDDSPGRKLDRRLKRVYERFVGLQRPPTRRPVHVQRMSEAGTWTFMDPHRFLPCWDRLFVLGNGWFCDCRLVDDVELDTLASQDVLGRNGCSSGCALSRGVQLRETYGRLRIATDGVSVMEVVDSETVVLGWNSGHVTYVKITSDGGENTADRNAWPDNFSNPVVQFMAHPFRVSVLHANVEQRILVSAGNPASGFGVGQLKLWSLLTDRLIAVVVRDQSALSSKLLGQGVSVCEQLGPDERWTAVYLLKSFSGSTKVSKSTPKDMSLERSTGVRKGVGVSKVTTSTKLTDGTRTYELDVNASTAEVLENATTSKADDAIATQSHETSKLVDEKNSGVRRFNMVAVARSHLLIWAMKLPADTKHENLNNEPGFRIIYHHCLSPSVVVHRGLNQGVHGGNYFGYVGLADKDGAFSESESFVDGNTTAGRQSALVAYVVRCSNVNEKSQIERRCFKIVLPEAPDAIRTMQLSDALTNRWLFAFGTKFLVLQSFTSAFDRTSRIYIFSWDLRKAFECMSEDTRLHRWLSADASGDDPDQLFNLVTGLDDTTTSNASLGSHLHSWDHDVTVDGEAHCVGNSGHIPEERNGDEVVQHLWMPYRNSDELNWMNGFDGRCGTCCPSIKIIVCSKQRVALADNGRVLYEMKLHEW